MKKFSTGIIRSSIYSIFILVCLLLDARMLRAQSVVISAVVRPRFEVQDGYRFPPDTGSTPQVLVTQRTRLNALFSNDRFSAYVSLQDARVWGDEIVATDNPSVGVHEAWAQYNFSSHLGLKVGRQELLYDNKRLLTDGLWIQQGRAYDAATLKIALNEGWRVDAVGSYNQAVDNYYGTFYNLSNPKTLDFLWLNKSKTDSNYHYSVSAMVLGDGYQTPDTTGIFMRYTYGINSSFDHHKWGINLEIYGQGGKTRAINQAGTILPDSFQTVKAYMFSVNPWIQVTRNFRTGIGVDYLSGSNALDSTRTETNMFNPQYGAAHRFYGKMDIFFNLPAGTRNGGLVDAYLNLLYIYHNWNFNLDYHHFNLENNVKDVENPGQALHKYLASEIDFIVTKDISKQVNINAGYCILFPTRSLEFTKTSNFSQVGTPVKTGHWFYVMLTFTPVFYSK